MKTCTKCKTTYELSNFSKDKKSSDGLTFHCKSCLAIKFAAWRAKNRDKNNAQAKDWGRANPEICKARASKWNKDNKELVNLRCIARKKHIKQATPKWVDKLELETIYRNRPIGFHVDHIVPLQGGNVCGLHVPYNLQYLPAAENIAKGNRF